MTTLGDLAKRLYDKFAATQELLEPKKIRFEPTRWEDLPDWRQEVWVTVAAEAVRVGSEIQQEIERQDAEANRAAMRRALADDPVIGRLWEDILADMPDEAPKLRDLAAQPRRFARDCE